MDKLFDLIIKYGKIDQYERYMLSGSDRMQDFIASCAFTPREFAETELYSISTAGIFDREHRLISIKQFMRLPDGRPYIPGSSPKGALRTAILHGKIREGSFTKVNLHFKKF